MVWTAVGFGLFAIQFAWTVRREYYWRGISEMKESKIGILTRAWDETIAEREEAKDTVSILSASLTSLENIAKKADDRYEALVEKLRVQASKPDDGIIHAKNSGDVRRMVEHSVAAEMMKFEKQQEN